MKNREENNGKGSSKPPIHQLAYGDRKMFQVSRRRLERVPIQFSLTYSGMYEGQMFIGNGVVTNLSETGIGVCGHQLVYEGMELALMIDIPAVEDPVCVAQSCVSWANGRRFGVEVLMPDPAVQQALHLSIWNHLIRTATRKS